MSSNVVLDEVSSSNKSITRTTKMNYCSRLRSNSKTLNKIQPSKSSRQYKPSKVSITSRMTKQSNRKCRPRQPRKPRHSRKETVIKSPKVSKLSLMCSASHNTPLSPVTSDKCKTAISINGANQAKLSNHEKKSLKRISVMKFITCNSATIRGDGRDVVCCDTVLGRGTQGVVLAGRMGNYLSQAYTAKCLASSLSVYICNKHTLESMIDGLADDASHSSVPPNIINVAVKITHPIDVTDSDKYGYSLSTTPDLKIGSFACSENIIDATCMREHSIHAFLDGVTKNLVPKLYSCRYQFIPVQRCMMIMEHFDCTMSNTLCKNASPSRVSHYIYQLVKGVEMLHSLGIMHRDIKPNNILINGDQLRIADFGLAIRMPVHHDQNRLISADLQFTTYVVTRWYRAPELLVNDCCTQPSQRVIPLYNCRIDIWAVVVSVMQCVLNIIPSGCHGKQMQCIIGTIGAPTTQEINDLYPDNTSMFLILHNSSTITTDVSSIRKMRSIHLYNQAILSSPEHCTMDLCDLLAWGLSYSPHSRPSASQLLTHRYFTQ